MRAHPISFVPPFALMLFFALGSARASAQQVTFDFDHFKENASRSWRVDLERGQEFVFKITNTCPADFEYRLEAVTGGAPSLAGRNLARPLKALEAKEIKDTHDPRWAGYILHVEKVSSGNSCHKPDDPEAEADLKPVVLIVSVATPEWNVSVTGGFTVSTVTNKVFASRPENGKYVVVREADKEDAAALGLASFVIAHHTKQPLWMPSPAFGLGLHSDNKVTYHLGAAYRFGDKGAVSFGFTLGPSARLPDGVQLNTPLDAAPSLSTLPTRTSPGVFVGMSYSVIDTREALQKPFKGAPEKKEK